MTMISEQVDKAPILVFAYGNPSRGDDGLGPAMHNMLEEMLEDEGASVDLLTDFQLQVEHAVDLHGRDGVLFIDAGMASDEPFDFHPLQAKRDDSITSHAMSPSAVLDVYREVHQQKPPPSYMLTIRGYEFELGSELSEQARNNLRHSLSFLRELLSTPVKGWTNII